MPENQHTFAHSLRIARKVLPFLGENALPATPENYMIFYLYFDGTNPGVNRVVDAQLNNGRPWVEETTLAVFEQLFGTRANLDFMKANQDLAQQVKATADDILKESSQSAELARQTSHELNASLSEARNLTEMRGVVDWLAKTLSQVNLVKESSEGLDHKIKERSDRLASLLEHLARVEKLALMDELTQLSNRRAWDARIAEEHARFKRYRRPCSVLMLDIDNFKRLNDTFGHQVGDQALKAVANIIQKSLREADFPARYGGEEFTCLFPETPLPNAATAAEKIRVMLSATRFTVKNRPAPITASIGVASFRDSDQDHQPAMKRADMAMYLAKSKGKNRVYTEVELAAAKEAMLGNK